MRHLKSLIKNKYIFLLAICSASFLLSGCEVGSSFAYEYDSRDTDKAGGAFKITKSDEREAPKGVVEYLDLDGESYILIEEAGEYMLSGSMRGQVAVDAEDGNVHLFLNGVNISSSLGPAIYVKSAGKVIITLCEKTENTISDSANYEEFEDYEACIFSNEDLTINGSGELTLFSYVADGIRCKDVLKILGGDIYILAKKNALRGNDGVYLKPEELAIECEGYGIVADINTKGECGDVYICGGDISLTTGKQPITSRGNLDILEADVEIYSVLPDFDVAGKVNIEKGAVR